MSGTHWLARWTTLAVVVIARPAAAQSASADTAEINTAATATRSIRPDLATLTLQFHVMDSTPARAGERLALRADSVRRTLMALGIPRDSLVTGSRWYWWNGRLEVIPRTRCVPSPDPRIGCVQFVDTTYRARESIEVRIRDLTKVGAVFDAALSLGILDISPIHFSATDLREARRDALREATLLAREQADIIAAAGGGRVGRVMNLSTHPEYITRYGGLEEIVVSGMAQSGASTEITAPAVHVGMTVYGRWRFEPRP